jgi:hypothetical protein
MDSGIADTFLGLKNVGTSTRMHVSGLLTKTDSMLSSNTATRIASVPSSSSKMQIRHNDSGSILVSTSPYLTAASMPPSTTAVSSETS